MGPKLAGAVTKLVVTLINKLGPLGKLLKPVIKLLPKLLGNDKELLGHVGALFKILAGGKTDLADRAILPNGKPAPFPPAEQHKLAATLTRTVGPYTARNVVHVLAVIINGNLLNKLGVLTKIVKPVIGLIQKLLLPRALVGKLLGRKGLGALVSKLLGANPKADAAAKGGVQVGGNAEVNTGANAGGLLGGLLGGL